MNHFDKTIPTNFIVASYGESTKENEAFTRVRMRVFYQGANRNRTYISESFAKTLLDGVYGHAIVGKYDAEKKDFTDHATKEDTRPYGFVPHDHNFAWEKHLDEDGIERTYATFDVLLWTGRYEHAKEIIGKPQSMELDPKTITGFWRVIDGDYFFEFEKGNFLGFCVLGESVEPCFEGSAFFTSEFDYTQFFEDMRTFALSQFAMVEDKASQGGTNVDKKLEILAKYNLTLETIDFNLEDFSEEELETKLAADFADASTQTADLEQTTETSADFVEVGSSEGSTESTEQTDFTAEDTTDVVMPDFALGYRAKRDILSSLLVDSYVQNEEGEVVEATCYYLADFDDNYVYVEKGVYTASSSDYIYGRYPYVLSEDGKNASLNGEFEVMVKAWITEEQSQKIEAENSNAIIRFTALEEKCESLEKELISLQEYKVKKEDEVKDSVFAKFEHVLNEEDMEPVMSKKSEYTLEQIDDKLCAIAYRKASGVSDSAFIYNNINTDASDNGVIAILKKHKKS